MIFWDKFKHLQESEDKDTKESEDKDTKESEEKTTTASEATEEKAPSSSNKTEPPPEEKKKSKSASKDKEASASTASTEKNTPPSPSPTLDDTLEDTVEEAANNKDIEIQNEIPQIAHQNNKPKPEEIIVEAEKPKHNTKPQNGAPKNKKPNLIDFKSAKSWYDDNYETVLTQRNILFIVMIVCVIIILSSIFLIRFIKSRQNIEPFVIEIEEKTGVPTVVQPLGIEVYSQDEAVKKYFIMQYIRAREEYYPALFDYNYENVVRVLSDQKVYYNDYRPLFSKANPTSPYNLYGQTSIRKVLLKSLIFRNDGVALVRVAFDVTGSINMRQDKIILIGFEFKNMEMNEAERLINPLGFIVTFYRIEDDKI